MLSIVLHSLVKLGVVRLYGIVWGFQIYMSRAVKNHMFWDCPLVNGEGVADLGNFNEFKPLRIPYDGP